MSRRRIGLWRGVLSVVALAISLVGSPRAAFAQLQLTPIATGLHSPVFIGPAGDGTKRLFIVEQGGVIRVLQPGASAPSVFLDIQQKTSMQTASAVCSASRFIRTTRVNGRFFVYYTRAADGAIVIAEYGCRTNPNVADTAETVLLDDSASRPTPTTTAACSRSGPTATSTSASATAARATTRRTTRRTSNVLLGKILRIDVDHADPVGACAYSSPADNPFVGRCRAATRSSRIGLRNPWRFSFDRV